MEKYIFKDNLHRDTIFAEDDQVLKLLSLFGLPMESRTRLADRITGMVDIYCDWGAMHSEKEIKTISLKENEFICEMDLYDGRLRYVTRWTYESGIGVFTRKDSLYVTGSVPVTLMKAMQRYLFAYDEFYAYTQNTRWCYENVGNWQKVDFGGISLACEGGRTSQGAAPYLALKTAENRGVVFHLVPNGNWKMDFKTVSLGVGQAGEYGYLLELGQSNDHFAMRLEPGEEFHFPVVIIQNLADGCLLKTASNLQKYFLQTDGGRHRREHPVVYNPWFEHYALLDRARLEEHVKTAKDLGCEVFEVDAGWYGSKEGDWWNQSGDWNEKTDGAFYGKMPEFVEYVKSEGLGFGLWMEPERIGADTPVRMEHPEYFAWGNGYYYPKLYEKEVYDYMYSQITGLIEKYGLSWMKMDFNFELGEDLTASEFYRYYEAWYRLLDQVKENYPDTFLEGCAAGGMRNDIHTTCVYDGHFLSDNVNAWDMQATYQQCVLRLPHYRLIKWLVISPGAKISLYDSKKIEKTDTLITTQRPGAGWDEYERISPEFACQLTMAGPVGLSGNYIDISPEQKQIFRKYITFYKKFRSFFKESTLYLSKEPYNVGDRDGFYHIQYANQKNGEQLVFAYRYAAAANEYRMFLTELEEEKNYRMYDPLTGELIGEYSGEDLMHRGLELEFATRHSGKLFHLL